MASSLERFDAVWSWYRVSVQALEVFEVEARERPERHLRDLAAESQQEVLAGIGTSRDELENFALLSLWAVFEETINGWLLRRIHWIQATPESDRRITTGLQRQVIHWRVAEKIDALALLIGEDAARNLQTVRKWRDWVAHRKTGPRPTAVDFETAQTLFEAVLTELEDCPQGESASLA